MNKIYLTNANGFRIPHREMVDLTKKGLINTSFVNSYQIKKAIKLDTELSKEKRLDNIYLFINFLLLLIGMYFSFVLAWYSVLVAFFLMMLVRGVADKYLIGRYLKRIQHDESFYHRLMSSDCLMYETNVENSQYFDKFSSQINSEKIIMDLGAFMMKEDFDIGGIYDVNRLPHSKADTQLAFLNMLKATQDEKMKGVYQAGLLLSCQFFEDVGQDLNFDSSNLDAKHKYEKLHKKALEDFNNLAKANGIKPLDLGKNRHDVIR